MSQPQPASNSATAGQIVVGISDFKTTGDARAMLVTHSLGSCIGVAAHCPARKISGLLHFQLPEAAMDASRAQNEPAMFADTGLDALIQAMQRRGADTKRLQIRLAGGAKMLSTSTFDIGKRNHLAIRKALWKHGLFVAAENCGGSSARTLYMRCSDGAVRLRMDGKVVAL
ncbi:MAG: chemotaxis protein CheD [Planctomycetota bacterium]